MSTLYRKYRPQVFREAVGQNHIKVTLQNEIQTGKTAHAYLFCGPRAVGKTTFARLFAKAVNCPERKDGDFEPCNECQICQEITTNKSLDIIEIDAASHTGVDNIRDNIIAGARISPSKNKYKVFIIDEVHMLSINAFNALLKTLEEPPKNVIFILCTTEVHRMPATVISRCERFDFRRIGIDDVVKKLNHIVKAENIKVDEKILKAIARQSEGHMRDAESLLGQIISISGKEVRMEDADLVIPRSDTNEIVKLIEMLFKKDATSSVDLINNLLDNGVNLERFLTDFIEILRKIMLGKVNIALEEKLGTDIGEEFEMKLNEIKKDITLPVLIVILEKFIEAKSKIKSSFIAQLPIELAIIEICLTTGNQPSQNFTANHNTTRNNPVIKNTELPPIKNVNPTPPPIMPSIPNNINDVKIDNTEKIEVENKEESKAQITESNIDKELLLSRWNEFLARIKKYNHSLSFVLKVCQPREVIGNKVRLAFKYKFHRDRINEIKIKELVEKALTEVYGALLKIEAIIDENLEIEMKNSEENTAKEETPAPDLVFNKTPQEEELKEDLKEDLKEESKKEEPKKDVGMVDDLLKAFGGKVVG